MNDEQNNIDNNKEENKSKIKIAIEWLIDIIPFGVKLYETIVNAINDIKKK